MSNVRARDALERAHRLFLDRPSAAKKANSSATAVWREGLRCETTGPLGETAVTDMPVAMGGDGTGPNPGWLLRASLASCAATAIAMRAALLGIALRELEVSVHSETDARGLFGIGDASTALSGICMRVKIGADHVPEAQLRELVAWAGSTSVVSRTLRESPAVAIDVSVV